MIDLVGTPKYPLSEPSRKQVFEPGFGEVMDEQGDLAALIRTIHKRKPFDFGHCYSNTEKICSNAWENGWGKLRLYPFAGWIRFDADPNFMVHHAWVILDGSRIIDMGCLRMATTIDFEMEPQRNAMREEFKDQGKTDFEFAVAWRLKYCKALLPHEEGDPVENRVWGQVPPRIVYAGNPCHWDEAIRIYNRWNKTTKRDAHVTPTQLISMLIRKGLTPEQIQQVVREMQEKP
jgi:hypothetical protein